MNFRVELFSFQFGVKIFSTVFWKITIWDDRACRDMWNRRNVSVYILIVFLTSENREFFFKLNVCYPKGKPYSWGFFIDVISRTNCENITN